MPVYKTSELGYLRRYGFDFNKVNPVTTKVIIPADPDILVLDPNPVWDPVLFSVHDTVAASGTNTYAIPFTRNRHNIQIKVLSGEIEVRFRDLTTNPLIYYQTDVPYDFLVSDHFIDNIYITGVTNSEYILNIYEIMSQF